MTVYLYRFWKNDTAQCYWWTNSHGQRHCHNEWRRTEQAVEKKNLLRSATRRLLHRSHPKTDPHSKSLFLEIRA